MLQDFEAICDKYSAIKEVHPDRIKQIAILLWVKNHIGDVPVGDYPELELLIAGKHPFPGRWVKSEERKRTKGTARPENDETCYSFEQFWKDYGFKTGLSGAREIWAKLDEAKRERIKLHLPGYVSKTITKEIPGAKFKPKRAQPTTYLNDSLGKYWKGFEEVEDTYQFPEDHKLSEHYKSYLTKHKNIDTGGKLLYTFPEFERLNSANFSLDGRTIISRATLQDVNTQAHVKTAENKQRVWENLLSLLKERLNYV